MIYIDKMSGNFCYGLDTVRHMQSPSIPPPTCTHTPSLSWLTLNSFRKYKFIFFYSSFVSCLYVDWTVFSLQLLRDSDAGVFLPDLNIFYCSMNVWIKNKQFNKNNIKTFRHITIKLIISLFFLKDFVLQCSTLIVTKCYKVSRWKKRSYYSFTGILISGTLGNSWVH